MASDDGEHTRFPCLATLRSLVATVITVLAVVVVVMVIVVVHRPEDISFSISNGYVQSEQLWWTAHTHVVNVGVVSPNVGVVSPNVGTSNPDEPADLRKDEEDDVSLARDAFTTSRDYEVITTYAAAKPPVSLRFTWSARNPSGRGEIDCNITSIRVLDMTNPSSMGMEIGSIFYHPEPLRFSVPPQATHTDTQWVVINDTATLQYIFDQYEGKSSFSAMVQVKATITSKALFSSATRHSVNHYCGPVNVVYSTPDDTAYGDLSCKMEQRPFPVGSQPPAPAPAPKDVAG